MNSSNKLLVMIVLYDKDVNELNNEKILSFNNTTLVFVKKSTTFYNSNFVKRLYYKKANGKTVDDIYMEDLNLVNGELPIFNENNQSRLIKYNLKDYSPVFTKRKFGIQFYIEKRKYNTDQKLPNYIIHMFISNRHVRSFELEFFTSNKFLYNGNFCVNYYNEDSEFGYQIINIQTLKLENITNEEYDKYMYKSQNSFIEFNNDDCEISNFTQKDDDLSNLSIYNRSFRSNGSNGSNRPTQDNDTKQLENICLTVPFYSIKIIPHYFVNFNNLELISKGNLLNPFTAIWIIVVSDRDYSNYKNKKTFSDIVVNSTLIVFVGETYYDKNKNNYLNLNNTKYLEFERPVNIDKNNTSIESIETRRKNTVKYVDGNDDLYIFDNKKIVNNELNTLIIHILKNNFQKEIKLKNYTIMRNDCNNNISSRIVERYLLNPSSYLDFNMSNLESN